MALHYYGGIFRRNVAASGVVPQISVIMGSCAGGAVYSPAITDFVFMVQAKSQMFITGPDVVRAVTGEEITHEELGGALTHATKSGVACFVSPDEHECLDQVKRLLSYLPSNNQEPVPNSGVPMDGTEQGIEPGPERDISSTVGIVPKERRAPYDVRSLLAEVVDGGDILEYHSLWARNLVCGFARVGGRVVGLVANQPEVLAGMLDVDATEKGARFVRTCDCFGIPVVTFVDVPGFMPGTDQEHGGLARRGAKLLYAYCEASVPKITVVVRKAYGGAYMVMGAKSLGTDLVLAWPEAELAMMGAESAVDVLHGPVETDGSVGERAELVERYRRANPSLANSLAHGYVDEVIEPAATRRRLHRALVELGSKRADPAPRKHANIPL